MNKKKIIAALNTALSDELGAIFQYMWHHFEGRGLESQPILGMMRMHALDEMRHSEMLAERICLLGGEPTNQPGPIKRGGGLKKMIQDDLSGEEAAVKDYRKMVAMLQQEGDPTSRSLIEALLADEERHADALRTLMET